MANYEIVGAEEIIGEDELDYEDDYEDVDALLGQLPRPTRRVMARRGIAAARRPILARRGYATPYQRARTVAAAVKQVEGSTLVRQSAPTKSRNLVIGFVQTAIAAAASATVTQRPQVLFRPQRVVVPASLAPNFTIDDIKVGNKSQLISAGAVPAEAFAQTSFGVEMKMDTCQISMDLILEVTNISAAASDFRASVYGEAAE